jgi:hypothetical protein
MDLVQLKNRFNLDCKAIGKRARADSRARMISSLPKGLDHKVGSCIDDLCMSFEFWVCVDVADEPHHLAAFFASSSSTSLQTRPTIIPRPSIFGIWPETKI